jgi:hypothetical protein
MKEQWTDSINTLKTDGDFLAFLKEASQSDEYQELKNDPEHGGHPTADILYDYVLDDLDDEDDRYVRNHIAVCSECFKEVQHIREIEQESEKELVKWANPFSLTEWLKDLAERFREFLTYSMPEFRFGRPFAYALSGICVVTICCVITVKVIIPYFNPLNQSYRIAITQNLIQSEQNIRLPWEISGRTSYGFSSAKQVSPDKRAFGAGLWIGKEKLSEKEKTPMPEFLKWKEGGPEIADAEDWSETEWKPYFSMGRWCFLIHAVCLSDKDAPDEFWEKQGEILGGLKKAFDEIMPEHIKTDQKIIGTVLNRVEAALNAREGKAPDKKSRRKIAREIGQLISYLGGR